MVLTWYSVYRINRVYIPMVVKEKYDERVLQKRMESKIHWVFKGKKKVTLLQ